MLNGTFAHFALALLVVTTACGTEPETVVETPHPPDETLALVAPVDEPTFVSLSDRFSDARIENAVEPSTAAGESLWSFADDKDHGWLALPDIPT